nr:unnamed protein product [Digitaria exilis]
MWRLKVAEGGGPWLRSTNNFLGRAVWEFDAGDGTPEELDEVERARREFTNHRFQRPYSADLLMRMQQVAKANPVSLGLPVIRLEEHEDVTEEAVSTTLKRAISRFSTLQAHDGHWPGDFGGPSFLMPGLNEDGGWGLHVEGPSTMFGSTLSYVSLRLLGEGADGGNGAMQKGRRWILDHGGATFTTSWGKFWLSVLGVFDWSGNNPVPPECYNGSQLWDTAFSIQAIVSTNLVEEFGPTLKLAHDYIKNSQFLDDCPGDLNYWHRHISKGGWAFSTLDQGWPVSDCTAEGLQVSLLLSTISPEIVGKPVEANRLYDAVNCLMSWMVSIFKVFFLIFCPCVNWNLKKIAKMLLDVRLEISFRSMALTSFRNLYPEYRRKEVDNCISKAANFIESVQRSDGSWYGTWAVCFTYGAWFGVKGLTAAGRTFENSPAIRKACDFLLSKEFASGGWGESYLSSQDKVYTEHEGRRPHVVHTSWAMLALIDAGQVSFAERNPMPLHRAAKILVNLQSQDGEFPHQEFVGVTNQNCLVNYSNYRSIFPIWALGEYRCRVLASSGRK